MSTSLFGLFEQLNSMLCTHLTTEGIHFVKSNTPE